MKYISLVFCSLLLFASCKKDKEDLKEILDVSFQFSTNNLFTLPKVADSVHNIPDSTITVTTPSIVNTAPDEFKKNKADINKLKSLTIENVQLTVKTPAGQTFAFMKSISIYISATGKPEVLIATKNDINKISPASGILQLTAQKADISEYLKGADYKLRIQTALVKTYTNDIAVNCEVKYLAVANPLN